MTNERFVSYAQNLEDVMLWRALSGEAGASGQYIDVGAADPTSLSVTRAFYGRGWRGVSVEPLPEQAVRLRKARPEDTVVEAALSNQTGEGATSRFYRVMLGQDAGLSTLDQSVARQHEAAGAIVTAIEVPVTTLAALCREHVHGPVHFLKIDVEGAEAAVLAGADFAAVRPWIVLVEATHPLDPSAMELDWEPDLLAAGYRRVWFDGLNRFYLAEERAGLARHFQAPPNVFDNYTVHDAPLQEHLAAAEALSETRRRNVEALEQRIAELERSAGASVPPAAVPPLALPTLLPAADEDARPTVDLPFTRNRIGRRLGKAAYGLVRPIARPLAWRSRQFVIGELKQEMAGLRTRLDQLIARPVPVAGGGGDLINPGTISAVERLLLTLALEDGRQPAADYAAEWGAEPPTSGLSKPNPAR